MFYHFLLIFSIDLIGFITIWKVSSKKLMNQIIIHSLRFYGFLQPCNLVENKINFIHSKVNEKSTINPIHSLLRMLILVFKPNLGGYFRDFLHRKIVLKIAQKINQKMEIKMSIQLMMKKKMFFKI